MAGEVYALFNQYQQKHPYCTKEAIADMMLKDGVITKKVADKIKSGTSLFLLDDYTKKPDNNIDMAKIMGGNFTKKPVYKRKSKTNFNRKIEPTFQSEKQGDCWLLSDINALNQTGWGKQAIHDAIIPDADGSCGVTIKFKGSPIKQKIFHFTAKDIQNAKNSGKYSSGDDDMIALELAAEQTLKSMVEEKMGKRVDDFDELMGWKSYLFGVITDEKHNKQVSISNLLGIERIDIHIKSQLVEEKSFDKAQEKILKYIADNFDKTANVCNFMGDFSGERYKNEEIHANHAYAIKKIYYGKAVVVIDPYHADKEIKLTWDKFLEHVESIYTSVQNGKVKNGIYKALPVNYEQKYNMNAEKLYEQQKKDAIKYKKEQDSLEQEKLKKEKEAQERKRLEKIERDKKSKQKISNAIDIVGQAINKNNIDIIYGTSSSSVFDKDTILPILEKYPKFVLWVDKLYYGWGNGKKKSDTIYFNVIQPLAEKAKEMGIGEDTIKKFKKKCMRELDAIFYTDEKVIQLEVEKMVKLIKSKSNT